MAGISDAHFSSEKARVLSKVDLSRKGSVDEPIAELVSYVNSLRDFYTTSSCSGRLVVLQEELSLSSAVGPGGRGYAYFKFEPFVLHAICRTLEDAQTMGVRSTQCLEVPVIHDGSVLYLKHLVKLGNTKMQENLKRIERFFGQLKELMTKKCIASRSKRESDNAQRAMVQKVDKKANKGADSKQKDTNTEKTESKGQ